MHCGCTNVSTCRCVFKPVGLRDCLWAFCSVLQTQSKRAVAVPRVGSACKNLSKLLHKWPWSMFIDHSTQGETGHQDAEIEKSRMISSRFYESGLLRLCSMRMACVKYNPATVRAQNVQCRKASVSVCLQMLTRLASLYLYSGSKGIMWLTWKKCSRNPIYLLGL